MVFPIAELLDPISQESPAGVNLRYAQITADIREARRQDDELNQGVWARTVKSADYSRVIVLGTKALKTQSKDLQIAAWLAEAFLVRDGFPGLLTGLQLIQELLERYWETVYPQPDPEDGDLGLRSTAVEWVSTQLDRQIKSVALNSAGHTWTQYIDSRTIPSEEEASARTDRGQVRTDALQSGRIPPEAFDREFSLTPRKFFEALNTQLEDVLAFPESFNSFCADKFSGNGPDLGALTGSLNDVHRTLHVMLVAKREKEPDPTPEPVVLAPVAVEEAAPVQAIAPTQFTSVVATPAPVIQVAPVSTASIPTAPAIAVAAGAALSFSSVETASAAIVRAVHYLRDENPEDPISYLTLRALRWSGLRNSAGQSGGASAPPVETRMELKRLAAECDWTSLVANAEKAFAEPYGNKWLDLQRYTVTGLQSNGNDAAASAILDSVKVLLTQFPDLHNELLADDTPVAGRETQEWLRTQQLLMAEPVAVEIAPVVEVVTPTPSYYTPIPAAIADADETGVTPVPDVFETALEYTNAGRVHEGIALLTDALSKATIGRDRFHRQVQLAKICLAASEEAVALPLLEDLALSIAHHDLAHWEAPAQVSEPLAMLFRCRSKLEKEDTDAAELFAQICRINPMEAFDLKPWHVSPARE